MEKKRFTRRVESFICERCGTEVAGNGYTDHCPSCLWSKHVDIHPGDRESRCGGLMEPISAMPSGRGVRISYRCSKCGIVKKVVATENDNPDIIDALSLNPFHDKAS